MITIIEISQKHNVGTVPYLVHMCPGKFYVGRPTVTLSAGRKYCDRHAAALALILLATRLM